MSVFCDQLLVRELVHLQVAKRRSSTMMSRVVHGKRDLLHHKRDLLHDKRDLLHDKRDLLHGKRA